MLHYRIVNQSKDADPSRFPINVMLINIEGESAVSLHEPIGIEAVASRLVNELPHARIAMYDTQPELVQFGKVDTDRLARQVKEFADGASGPFLLGLGIPIDGWNYAQSLLLKLEQDPPDAPITVVLGNAVPTYTKPDLIRSKFPYVKLIVGEGEEAFAAMARKLAQGAPVEDVLVYALADLDAYVSPLRTFTQDIIDMGGSVKVESGRGCPHGGCTFCSRALRGGKDYRPLPASKVVSELLSLAAEFGITRFELTDEEAFGATEATARLISALESADLPRIPFVASVRVDILNDLQRNGLLDRLCEIGLEKVFVGVEGGSDRYLQQLAKKQTMDEVRQAIRNLKEYSIDYEIGFITFSWRMTFPMLRENIMFLSEGDNVDHVSALFNVLMVRAGSGDELLLRQMANRGRLGGYDPDSHFNINYSCYNDVPFLDERVARAYRRITDFAQHDAEVYYALKSLVRAKALPPEAQSVAEAHFRAMKRIHLRMLRKAVGLGTESTNEVVSAERKLLVENIRNTFLGHPFTDGVEILLRETQTFLVEESERIEATPDQTGSLLVFQDQNGRILVSRARGEDQWSFPGGNTKEGEDIVSAGMREAMEELGITKTRIIRPLQTIVKFHHHDRTTGDRPSLTLHHHLALLDPREIRIQTADQETADILWLSPDDILAGRIDVKSNVVEIAKTLRED